MDNAGYVLLSRQSSLMQAMDVTANNIANMSTDGFQREGLLFDDFLLAGGNDVSPVASTDITGRFVDLDQGSLVKTGRELDVAVEGDGFFRIQTPDGERLTRSGSFHIDAEGGLVTSQGFSVLDDAGAQVVLPESSEPISIARDGSISIGDAPLGRIGLVSADPEALSRAGGSLYAASGVRPATGSFVQGFLEQSNVNPVAEITRMIEVQRAFELGQSLMSQEDDRITTTIETLGRSV
ncbi:MAG: flagellar basal-body rod protein FlgF [Pseudomonadota bacterium]